MKNYDHGKIEKKWQKAWEKSGIYEAKDNSKKPKFYALIEFPFPSGDGMHTGHLRSNTAMDIISRKRRAEGFNVLYPIGWDAFGLPTENYAIKTGIHPAIVSKKNTDNFRRQLKSAGFSFDWSREINTTDPEYYRWTQWIFLEMYKKGLAYKKKMFVNWCPKDKTGLANEEVVDGKCERCGTPVEKREKEQWMLAITKYADRLDRDLDTVDYLEKIKIQQRNWIGKSEGAEFDFPVSGTDKSIKIFTTRADTIFGVTYVVLAPEHPLVEMLLPRARNKFEITSYVSEVTKKTTMDRTALGKEKTGIVLEGVRAVNPATKEEVPVWVADYVLPDYGTGAVMAVPAHDERDFEFAKKYNLSVKRVVVPSVESEQEIAGPYVAYGVLTNSPGFDGLESKKAQRKITEDFGKMVTTYKLRDWVFSRQRYWGEPIPMVYCEHCRNEALKKDGEQAVNAGWVPVPEKDLPVVLPNVKNFQPTDNGESPLASVSKWVNTKCPVCGNKARRETDTMPNWAGSSWYFLRYTDPKNKKFLADKKKLKLWQPVDWYNGGMEHTTLHLLYSRFWNKFLFDIGVAPTSEAYQKRTSHGFILAGNGEKMSKSRGNVVNPDQIIETFGADTLRVYEMFIGPFDQAASWNTDSIIGSRRFLERAWRLQEKVEQRAVGKKGKADQGNAANPVDLRLESTLNATIKKVSEDIETMRFNTAISTLMILSNEFDRTEVIRRADYESFIKLLAPFAPHMTEELWLLLGNKGSIHGSPWPQYDESRIKSTETTIGVSINGKVRAEMTVEEGMTEDTIKEKALSLGAIVKWISGKGVRKVIYVKGKLINIVVDSV